MQIAAGGDTHKAETGETVDSNRPILRLVDSNHPVRTLVDAGLPVPRLVDS